MELKPIILIADDSDSDRQVVTACLKNDYNVLQASSGEQCIEIANASQKPDLILLDIMMPDMDGYTVCSKLKSDETTKYIPIIFITALYENDNEYKGLKLGAVDYVSKPFNKEILNFRIANQLTAIRQAKMIEDQLHYRKSKETYERLINGLAHDFNNILATIMGYTELAIMNLNKNRLDKIKTHLMHVRNSSVRARDLVSQMSISSQKGDGRLDNLSLSKIVKDVIELINYQEANIDLELELDDDIIISVHEEQFKMMITNVCLNSIRAIKDAGTIRITSSIVEHVNTLCSSCHESIKDSFVQLRIEDSGTGIEEQHLENIFDPYFTTEQLDYIEGKGMGLALVHAIIHKHAGHLILDSQQGTGTIITLLLPTKS